MSVYYQVQCDEAKNPDKNFDLSQVEYLTDYLKEIKHLEYDVYLILWNEEYNFIEQMLDVKKEFN